MKFIPPKSVAEEAATGLILRQVYGRGGTSVGLTRARQLSKRKPVSLATIKRMFSFFSRHYKNRNTPFEEGNGRIAWLLWGGNPGYKWVLEILRDFDQNED